MILISLLLSQGLYSQIVYVATEGEAKDGLSLFVKNFARIKQNGKSFYIDTTGQYAFDRLYGMDDFVAARTIEQYRNELKNDPDGIPETVFAVFREKDEKWGILAPDGEWILKPEYDYEDEAFRKFEKPRFNPGSAPRPSPPQLSQFGDHYVLDEIHYAVEQAGKWGVYNVRARKMIIPAEYDKMDYCGGCGRKSNYVYAQKNGKWGIVSFKNKVLVPFRYKHAHMNMRSDEWVLSFKRNNTPVIVYIPTAAEFTDAELMEEGLLKIRRDGKTGLVNARGAELLPLIYDDIEEPFNFYDVGVLPYLFLHRDGLMGVADREGNIILDTHFEDISIHGPYFGVGVDGMYGLRDAKGKELLDPVYSDISSVKITHPDGSDTWLITVKDMGLYGFFDPGTGVFVPPAFHKVTNATSGFAGYADAPRLGLVEVTYEGKTGMYDLDGREVLPMKYDKWGHYDKEYPALLKVESDGKKGLYDLKTQREIIPPDYRWINKPESKTLVRVSTGMYGDGKNGVFTTTGEQVVPVEYGKITFLDNGRIQADTGNGYKSGLKGIFDAGGNTVLPVKYGEITPLTGKTWLLREKQDYSLFLPETQKNISLNYPVVWKTGAPEVLLVGKDSVAAQLYNIEKGKAYPEKYSTYHYNDQKDTTYTLPLIGKFSGGLARVDQIINGKFKAGFIDTQAKTVIPFEYDMASDTFKHGMTLLGKGGRGNDAPRKSTAYDDKDPGTVKEAVEERPYQPLVYGYADSTGRIVVPLKYHYYKNNSFTYITADHLFLVEQDRENKERALVGLADHKGKVLLQPEYSTIIPFENKRGFLLKKGGKKYMNGFFYADDIPPAKFGVADRNGTIAAPVEFDDIAFHRDLLHYETRVDLSFPVLCKKDGQWQYYTREGKPLKYKAEKKIDF